MLVGRSSPFGSRNRTRTLIALWLLEESYPRELARLLGVPLFAVQNALRGLEKDALAAGRLRGRTRLYRLNPQYFARKELGALLSRLVSQEPELEAGIRRLRRRPRQTGKPL